MSTVALNRVVHSLRRLTGPGAEREPTDRELLLRFTHEGDEGAFAQLVRRHGAMVLGVCRRVLRHHEDAEDAFQATFLVLARRAGSIAWHESVTNWLYGVALRTARKARARAARQSRRERQAPTATSAAPDASWREVQGVLDEELQRLPEKYREPLLLCCLEGRSRDEAAAQLGWTLGAVKGRLERGREMLRTRLARRGIALSAALGGALLGQGTASALSGTLVKTTIQAGAQVAAGQTVSAATTTALALSQGVFQTMLWTNLKLVTVIVTLLGLAGASGTMLTRQVLAGGQAEAQAPRPERDAQRAGEREQADRPREGRERDVPSAQGIFESLDTEKGTITVLPVRDGERAPQTYSLQKKDLPVTTGASKEGKLADLTKGMRVALDLTPDREFVVGIRVELPAPIAWLRAVDPAASTITVGLERREQTLKVAPDARIVLNGKPAKLADVDANRRVQLTLTLDRNTVVGLQTFRVDEEARRDRPREGDRPAEPRREGERPAEPRRDGDRVPDGERRRESPGVRGVLISVDAPKNQVTVLTGGDENPDLVTYDVSKTARVTQASATRREPHEIALAELGKGTRVLLRVTADHKTVEAIEAVPSTLRGAVIGVDAEKATLTIRGDAVPERTLPVEASAPVIVNRREGKLADLQRGMGVTLVLSLDKSKVIHVTANSREGADRR